MVYNFVSNFCMLETVFKYKNWAKKRAKNQAKFKSKIMLKIRSKKSDNNWIKYQIKNWNSPWAPISKMLRYSSVALKMMKWQAFMIKTKILAILAVFELQRTALAFWKWELILQGVEGKGCKEKSAECSFCRSGGH